MGEGGGGDENGGLFRGNKVSLGVYSDFAVKLMPSGATLGSSLCFHTTLGS